MRLRLLAAAALLPLVLTGCGSDDELAVPSPTSAPSVEASPRLASSLPVPRPSQQPTVSMTGDGVDLQAGPVLFGDTLDAALPKLTEGLGAPTKDTGVVDDPQTSEYGVCPREDLRVLEYADGGLSLFFGTQEGASAQTFYGWRIDRSGDDVPLARALVGDAATFDFGPGTTGAELQEGAGDAVEVEEGVADFGPSFTVTDQSSGFSGFIDGEGPDGVVRNVFGGEGCGE